MSIKPILFNTDMVRAILDGRKTVTRRLIKPQPTYCQRDGFTWKGVAYGTDLPPTIKGAAYNFRCNAPYQLGDILYVRETWKCWRAHRYEATADIMFRAGGDGVQIQFANGSTDSIDRFDFDEFVNKWFSHNGEWKPSLFMPKEAARLFLRVKDVRVERLQEITEEQAVKEGCQAGSYEYKGAVWGQEDTDEWTAIEDFANVWNSTIKKTDLDSNGWNANPWVWVIEFERCDKPEE